MRVRAEFTTEPFRGEDERVPAHVTAAASALTAAGLTPDLGPLGTAVDGEADTVVPAVAQAVRAALAEGATRVTLTVSDLAAGLDAALPTLAAARRRGAAQEAGAARGAGASAVGAARGGDSASGPAATTDLSDGLARLIAAVEEELGAPLVDLPRAGKQQAVRLLEERGAFEMRRSAETVAEAMGLTRFTVYNYLNRVREPVEPPAS
ncbi:helix-turn-helix domain-containing protein [Phycicoccus ginsengisoli]